VTLPRIDLTDGQVFTSAKACIYDPSEDGKCGEYCLTNEAAEWCVENSVAVILRHWPDNSVQLLFPDEQSRLLFCIRWDLTWALGT